MGEHQSAWVFRDVFAAKNLLPTGSFERALFFECTPLHALLVALVFDGTQSPFFAPDRELIARVADTKSLNEVRAAIRDYWDHPGNRHWLRRVGRVRISTRRLDRIAQQCLREGAC